MADDRRDSDTPTAVHTVSTSKLPVYKQTAEEFADKLDQIPEEHARRLALVFRAFAAEFSAWETDPNSRPPPDQRRERIDAYLAEYDKALALFSR
jgi:hypothetical protein